MAQPLTLIESIALTLVTGFVPAIITGMASFVVAQFNFKRDIQKIREQLIGQHELLNIGQIATLRNRYISPLKYWASILNRRLVEIEDKMDGSHYDQVKDWLQKLKDHADSTVRRGDFPIWCCYEGSFATSTIYYVSSYFYCAESIRMRSPFSELDPGYSEKLGACVDRVSEAFAGTYGIWEPIQLSISEGFAKGDAKSGYEEFCRIMDSKDSFKYGTFFRPIDVFIHHMDVGKVRQVRSALDGLISFINSRPTPEKRA